MSRCFRSVQNRFMNDIFCSARLLSAKCSKFPTSSSNYLTKHCCKVLRLKIGSECGSRMCKKTYRQATTTLNSRRKPVKFYSSRSSRKEAFSPPLSFNCCLKASSSRLASASSSLTRSASLLRSSFSSFNL